MIELSKKDKKAARQIIDNGLLRDYERAIRDMAEVIAEWNTSKTDNGETYTKLYQTISKHDKHIAQRYNYITRSKYIVTIISQLIDDVITPDDLSLSDDAREYITSAAKFLNKE